MQSINNTSCSDATKQKIADALKALMQTKSFDKISVANITNYCNIHRQTFYYHFVDKYELLNWMFHNELIAPLTSDFTLDNMYDKLNSMFITMKNEQSFYQCALKINADVILKYINNLAVQEFASAFDDIEKTYGLKPKDDKENKLLAEFFGYGISGVVLDWVSHGMRETPKELTGRIEHIINACKRLAISRADS
ncbi:MAG: TetR/AcrR family transcriptional regulator C-terminal domain-containing protein [Eubacterium sp.]|nr:TetR/AcrR family transcriptional regulator C-terminal domain-containing protein [Eubacterium sp.]